MEVQFLFNSFNDKEVTYPDHDEEGNQNINDLIAKEKEQIEFHSKLIAGGQEKPSKFVDYQLKPSELLPSLLKDIKINVQNVMIQEQRDTQAGKIKFGDLEDNDEAKEDWI